MKFCYFVMLLLFQTTLVWGAEIKLGKFDEAHLANLLHSLPDRLVEKINTPIPGRRVGEKVSLIFAPIDSGLLIQCWQKFFQPSPWASSGGCKLSVDLNSPSVKQQNDEIRIVLTDSAVTEALFEAIPYGKPLKRFYSFDKYEGITFDGFFDNLFTYRFTCSLEKCEVDLAAENLRLDE